MCVQGSSIDFENALEADAAATRFLMISPSVSVIVLEDLTVPTNTVNTIDCNGAALDLRDSGLDMSHTLNLYGGIIVLPFQVWPDWLCCFVISCCVPCDFLHALVVRSSCLFRDTIAIDLCLEPCPWLATGRICQCSVRMYTSVNSLWCELMDHATGECVS